MKRMNFKNTVLTTGFYFRRERKANFKQLKFTSSSLVWRSIISLFIINKISTAIPINILFSVIQNKVFG